MNCDETMKRLTEELHGDTRVDSDTEVERHLVECPRCREEAATIRQLWQRMGDFEEPVPSERMRSRFHDALEAYREGRRTGLAGRLQELFEQLWPKRPALQFGIALGALVVGLLLGGRLDAPGRSTTPDGTASAEIRLLREEMHRELQAMNQTVSLTLLEHQSASERLRGVEWSRRSEPDTRVVSALLQVVRDDPSVNVRLAAIEELRPLVRRSEVGRELLQTLEADDGDETPPAVRAGLAQVLLAENVDGSQPAVDRLLKRDDLNPTLRNYLQQIVRSST